MTTSIANQISGTLDVWQQVSSGYDFEQYWETGHTRANLKVLLQHIGDPGGQKILEVGCGSGYMMLALAKLKAQVALLDFAPKALEVACAEFEKQGLPSPECHLKDALDSGISSDSYDVVWNAGVIEHFYDSGKKKMLTEMYRIVKPGGKVIIFVPNAWCWPFQITQALLKLTKKWSYGYEDDLSPRRIKALCGEVNLIPSEVYAFNPIVGWDWVPILRLFLRPWIRTATTNDHSKRSWMGFNTVLVLQKPLN